MIPSSNSGVLRLCKKRWRLILAIATPIIFSTIPIYWKGYETGKEPWAAMAILIMSTYWMTECVPIAVTSFLPVVMYPLFGILSSDRVTTAYLQASILFLLGGCIIALAFEYCNLHTRIALKIIMMVGTGVSQLLFGIMFTTMFLSMWMNNTSTTSMMIPIVNAIVQQLDQETSRRNSLVIGSEMVARRMQARTREQLHNLKIMFLLGTAYSSNIGGTGVITGSSTNVIALNLIRKDAEGAPNDDCKSFLNISFLDWMIFNVPPMVVNTALCWVYLQLHFLGLPQRLRKMFGRLSDSNENVLDSVRADREYFEKKMEVAIRRKYNQLGPMNFQQIATLVLFLVLVVLWIFKDPQFMPGWDVWFQKSAKGRSYISEATPTLGIVMILFMLPSKWDYYQKAMKGNLGNGLKDTLLDWNFVKKRFPWGIFILLGGGSAMALGAKESGLNKWIGKSLEASTMLQACPNSLLLAIVLVIIAILTTIASNTACAAILTPVLLGLAYVKDTHPLYLAMAATTVCSYAFVLPVSTPPNALVYASQPDLKLKQMVVPGLVISLITVATLYLMTESIGRWYFNFDDYAGQCRNMTLVTSA